MTRLANRYLLTGSCLVFALLLYLVTLAPSVVTLFDDSLEFQLVTYQLGIAHPTGYPLYTLLGKLFTFIPVGNIAFRVNLMSAVFGAATVAGVYLLTVRFAADIGVDPFKVSRSNTPKLEAAHWPALMASLLSAGLLTVSPVFWQQATIAEVYTLNAFFLVLILLLVTADFDSPTHQLGWLALLYGLSLTHHRTMVLLLPALVVYIWLKPQFRLSPKTILLTVGVTVLPLSLYLYLPLRGHVGSLDGSYQNTWAGFWQHITASGYGSAFLLANPFNQNRDVWFYGDLWVAQFGWPVIFGLVGWLTLLRQRRYAFLTLTTLAGITYGSFNLFYQVADIEVFFIPLFLLWTVWLGIGLTAWLQALLSWSPQATRKRFAAYGLISLTLILLSGQLLLMMGQGDQELESRYTWQIHDYGIDILQQPVPHQATIVGILGEMTLIRYFQQTAGFRPDIRTITADSEADRLATVARLIANNQAVYLTRELPGAAERWSLTATGPLIRVAAEPLTSLPETVTPVDQPVTPVIKLLGYHFSRPSHTGSGPAPLRVTLFWQATAPLSANLKISARLLNEADELAAVVDAVPVHFAYPTTAWRVGEIVADGYELRLAASGHYKLRLIWYDPARNAAEVGRWEIDGVMVE